MRRVDLEKTYGQVWTTDELREDFEVIGFVYYMCQVRRKSDGAEGIIQFQHEPRFYYGFEESR
jgi:hypothetical protein